MDRPTALRLLTPLDLEQGLHLLDALTWLPRHDGDPWPRVADHLARRLPDRPRPAPEVCRRAAAAIVPAMARHPGPTELYRLKYDLMTLVYPAGWFTFMNLGHDDPRQPCATPVRPGIWRGQAALYDLVVPAEPLRDAEVLEIGSGRGGGAARLAASHRPRAMTGLDIAAGNVAFSRRAHRAPGLRFVAADARDLPFPAAAFDAVVSIETAHCCAETDRFFAEAARVLRPGGSLLFADEWPATDIDGLYATLSAAGFTVLDAQDITPGVIAALQRLPGRLQRWLAELPGGAVDDVYLRFFLERLSAGSAANLVTGRFAYQRVHAVRR